MQELEQLEKDLLLLGLLDKAREIYCELGESASLSYLRSSHRLLSKVYHPDLNPGNEQKAMKMQQRLNRVSETLGRLSDEQILDLVRRKIPKEKESKKKKILVVEDEFGLQEIFRDVFLMEGYDVKVAVDGDQGYELYRQFEPDLVFTDVVMPKMSGLELVRKIRETNPKIKVIYISGFFGIKGLKQDLDEEILRYGYPTLAKPFRPSAMLDLVREYVR
ncbi:MAG: response regulator [Deltaproteobacteria bacterium]|nr:response regulator [Deltaproteobacteria bacterium]